MVERTNCRCVLWRRSSTLNSPFTATLSAPFERSTTSPTAVMDTVSARKGGEKGMIADDDDDCDEHFVVQHHSNETFNCSAFQFWISLFSHLFIVVLHEASGFAAIEVINYANSSAVSVTPLPNMEIVVVNRTTGALNGHGQLGKIFIRSPYCAAVVTSSTSPLTKPKQPKTANDWVFSGFIGYYDNSTYLQVIDHYSNFSKSGHIFISKTLVETVLLSHPAVARAVAMKNATQKTSNEFQAFVTLKESDQQQFSEEALGTYLNCKYHHFSKLRHKSTLRKLINGLQPTLMTIEWCGQ